MPFTYNPKKQRYEYDPKGKLRLPSAAPALAQLPGLKITPSTKVQPAPKPKPKSSGG